MIFVTAIHCDYSWLMFMVAVLVCCRAGDVVRAAADRGERPWRQCCERAHHPDPERGRRGRRGPAPAPRGHPRTAPGRRHQREARLAEPRGDGGRRGGRGGGGGGVLLHGALRADAQGAWRCAQCHGAQDPAQVRQRTSEEKWGQGCSYELASLKDGEQKQQEYHA
jgi:hypothetical protein